MSRKHNKVNKMTNNIQELTKQWLEKHPFLKDIGEMNLSMKQNHFSYQI